MVVTFIGHAKLHYGEEIAQNLLEVLEKQINGRDVTFYLGCYGSFDGIALYACTLYKEKHDNAKLIFVTPYIDEQHFENRKNFLEVFDGIEYPDLENVPKRYAIAERNRYMIKQADLVIGYVSNLASNSRKMMDYAVSQQKTFINIFSQP